MAGCNPKAGNDSGANANPSLGGNNAGGDASSYVGVSAFEGNKPVPGPQDRSANFGATASFPKGGSSSRGPQG